MRRFTFFIALFALTALLSGSAAATIHHIDVGNFFFSPTNTVVSPGDTVRWTSVSGTHTTTSEVSSPKFWDSHILSPSWDVVFTAGDGPGPFPYLCSIHPTTMKDTIWMAPSSCCLNRGNVDGVIGGAGAIDVSDLTYLVAYLFTGGPVPPCIEEGNVDGVVGGGGPIDVSDLTYLVAYLFTGGAPPPPC